MTTLIYWRPVYHERRAYIDSSMMVRHSIRDERYHLGSSKPNYPVPAIRQRDWVHIGYLSALNGFDTNDAFEFIQRYY